MKSVARVLAVLLGMTSGAFAQGIPLFKPSQDPSQLMAYLNQLVIAINASIAAPGSFGNTVSNFGGLQFAVAQGTLSNPGGTMTGYVAGDTITLSCAGVTFTRSPIIGVAAVSGGIVTSGGVAYGGATSGPVPSGTAACTQASTSGVGTGYTVTVTFGVIASTVSIPALGTGGGAANGNFIINTATTDPLPTFGGSESTFLGDKAGLGFIGPSFFDTAVGHNALGIGGTGAASSNNTAMGTDAGRNIQGAGAANGNNTLIGEGAGRNISGGWNTFIGSSAGSTGVDTPGSATTFNTVALGYQTGASLTSGPGNTFIGTKAGSGIVAGASNIIIEGTSGGDNCANGDESNVFAVCPGAGRVLTIAGGATPATAVASFSGVTKLGGVKTVATLPTCNTGAEGTWSSVSDATAPTYNATLTGSGTVHVPVYCNGTAWTSH
jgi:hypothetical protein